MKLPSHFTSWKEKGCFVKISMSYIEKFSLSQKNDFLLRYMASIVIVVAGALSNAIAFVGGSYFAKYLSEDQNITKRRRRDMISLWRSIRRSFRSLKRIEQGSSIGLQLMTVSRHRKSIILLIRIRLLS